MTIDYIAYQDEVDRLKKAIILCSAGYKEACIIEAKAEITIDQILSRRIEEYMKQKSNLGIRMAVIMGMADKLNPEREQLKAAHKDWIDYRAKIDYIRVGIQALQFELMAVQGVVKYGNEGEKYLMV